MLEVKSADKDRLEFSMQSVVERKINFSWLDIKKHIMGEWKEKRIVAFIDSNVYEQSSSWVLLEHEHPALTLIPTNLNEASKNVESLLACLERMENEGFSRRGDLLIAIGGGVLMDLVSMAANLYRRGVAVIKVPTTLLGFVDASVGIKTGINFLGQRNRLGSYYLNYDVVYDTSLLASLSVDLIREGLGEIFKIALIKSKELFELLEDSGDKLLDPAFYMSDTGTRIISLSVHLMLEELHDNPTETNLKRCVDFGHSFSPGLEMASLTSDSLEAIPHGIAVGADCVVTSIIANNRGLFDQGSLDRVLTLANTIDFLPNHPLYQEVEVMWSSMMDMTKHRGDNQNLPYPTAIGEFAFIQDLRFDEMAEAIVSFRRTI